MSVFITILFILIAILLIGVILIQQPKTSGGLFSGTGQSLLGTSGKTFWTKFTIGLASVFMILCLAMAVLPKYEQPQSVTDIIEKQQQQAAQQQAALTPSASQPAPAAQAHPAPQSVPAVPAAVQPVRASSGAVKNK